MRVLIIEADRSIAGFVQEGLRDEGFHVDVVQRMDQIAASITAGEYDAVILDGDGLPTEVGEVAVRLWPRGPAPPLLVLTTPDDERAGGAGRSTVEFLSKPFRFDELLGRLARLAGNRTVPVAPDRPGGGAPTNRVEARGARLPNGRPRSHKLAPPT